MLAIMELGEFIYHVRYDLFTMLNDNDDNKKFMYFNSHNPSFSILEFMDFMQWSFVHYFYIKGRHVKNYSHNLVLYQELYNFPIRDNHGITSYKSVIQSFMDSQATFKEDHSIVYSVMIVGTNLIIGAENLE